MYIYIYIYIYIAVDGMDSTEDRLRDSHVAMVKQVFFTHTHTHTHTHIYIYIHVDTRGVQPLHPSDSF